MSVHTEINLEVEICEYLAAHGWLYERRRRGQIRSGTSPVPRGRARLGASRPAQGLGRDRQEPWGTCNRDLARPAARPDRPARDARCSAAWDRDAGPAKQAGVGAVQTGPGDQPRDPGPVRRQPAAGRPPGAVFTAQREQHRPCAVPEWHPGGDGRAQDRFHAERRRRDRPVSLRSPAQAQGPGRRAAALVSERGAGSLRRQQSAKCT